MLAVSSLAAFLAFLDVTIVNIAFPAIAAEFPESSAADLSWIFTAYNVTFAALLVPAGRLADLWGRRRVFLVGLALFGVASVVCAAAPTVGLLVAGRTAQAVAAALLAPSSLALLLPAFPAGAARVRRRHVGRDGRDRRGHRARARRPRRRRARLARGLPAQPAGGGGDAGGGRPS